MRKAKVLMHGILAAVLTETGEQDQYELVYLKDYSGPPVSLNLALRLEPYKFTEFPPFFDGLLPEGLQLEALLREAKIDRQDHFSQLLCVGNDLVGAVTIKPLAEGTIS